MSNQRGLGAVALVLALLIVALLYVGYLRMQTTTGSSPRSATTTLDNTKAFACRNNRQTAEREVQMWLVNHPGETPTLDAVGSTAQCPTGGTYTLTGVQVICSQHE
jgi:Tfp pilus assembly protein PilX